MEINELCKHREKVRSTQACISINSCTELIFPWSIAKSYFETVIPSVK